MLKENESKKKRLHPNEKEIIRELLKARRSLTAYNLAKRVNLSYAGTRNNLMKLKKKRIVIKEQYGRHFSKWSLDKSFR